MVLRNTKEEEEEELEAEEEDLRPQPPHQEVPTLLQTTMAPLASETLALTQLIPDMVHQQEETLVDQLEALSVDMEAEGGMPETLTCLMLLSWKLKPMKNMSTRPC